MLGSVFLKSEGTRQKEWGARPPRALSGAPPRRTLHPGRRTIGLGITRRNANGEGAVGTARGGRATRIRLSRAAGPQFWAVSSISLNRRSVSADSAVIDRRYKLKANRHPR
ncbi:MAG: hypothetical protein DME24_18000 [Verrucomicrobia bacterium]|nr:MAG: hypothetical protein DME24_18000 [Verrucomicrobiota bacterium]